MIMEESTERRRCLVLGSLQFSNYAVTDDNRLEITDITYMHDFRGSESAWQSVRITLRVIPGLHL
jgi:hypothetical protein